MQIILAGKLRRLAAPAAPAALRQGSTRALMPTAAPRLTVKAMASQDGRVAAATQPATSEGARHWAATGLQRIAVPVSAAVLIAVTIGVSLELPGRSASVIIASVAALAVAVAGVAFACLSNASARADTAALMAVGFAGSLLGSMLPATRPSCSCTWQSPGWA